MQFTQTKKNIIYYLQWNAITISLVFLFNDERLKKISDLLNLEIFPCATQSNQETDFQLLKKDTNFILKNNHHNEEHEYSTIDDLLMHTVSQISWCFLERSTQLILHGGAIVIGNEAILFSGMPHSGKSSLAAFAWLANHPIVGDDILACDSKNHTISAFPRPLRPRLPSLSIPSNILHRAGSDNVLAGQFSYDIGLFIGRKSPNMVAYHQAIKIKSLYYIERSETTTVRSLSRTQALTIALTQTYPNQHCLQIAEIVNRLSSQNAIKHLTIGDNAHQHAMEIMCE